MIDHEPEREREQGRADGREISRAYRSIWSHLEEVRQLELYLDKLAFKRTGLIQPAKLYGRNPQEVDPVFESAMQRLWDIGTIDQTGHADTELRRAYHLIAKGKAPVTESDVIALGQMSDTQLRLVLSWIAHRLSLAESLKFSAKGDQAPPVVILETAATSPAPLPL